MRHVGGDLAGFEVSDHLTSDFKIAGTLQYDFGPAFKGDLGHAAVQKDAPLFGQELAGLELGCFRCPDAINDLSQRGDDLLVFDIAGPSIWAGELALRTYARVSQ